MSTLYRRAEVAGAVVDVLVLADRVAAVGPGLPADGVDELVECGGGALLPGLTDHHVHLHALAAAIASVHCGPPAVRDGAALAEALRSAGADEHGWVRGVGYAEDVAGPLDAGALDALHPHRPVRVQHRGGGLWMLNSAAAVAVGLDTADHPGVERAADGTPTGRLWRADAWLRSRLPSAAPPALDEVGRRLAAFGITSVTDATPDLDPAALTALGGAVRSGALPQHVRLLGVPLAGPVPDGLAAGPYKIVLADSGLPGLDELGAVVAAAHAAGRAVAAHCVTVEALVLLLAALDSAGGRAGDRIEHAALVPADLLAELAARELTVVTQPGFLADRGEDYLRDVPAAEHRDLYRYASLLAAGVPVAPSSDAPYGPLDPWAVVDAAVTRRTGSSAVVGPDERVDASTALAGYLAPSDRPGGPVRRVVPGVVADLVLLADPLAEVLRRPRAAAVRRTVVAGRRVH